MRPVVYSMKGSEISKIGWQKSGDNINYFPNGIRRSINIKKSLYTLRFSYTFEYSDDIVYFAYSYPYTYSRVTDLLNSLEANPIMNEYITRNTLCQTVSGNRCEYITITSAKKLSDKKGICFTARVHPGETVGSWIMEGNHKYYIGLINFLADPQNPEAILLRDNFVFKIVPMLNPDGVINGNYRCALTGCDLNRRWKNPSKVISECKFRIIIQQYMVLKDLLRDLIRITIFNYIAIYTDIASNITPSCMDVVVWNYQNQQNCFH